MTRFRIHRVEYNARNAMTRSQKKIIPERKRGKILHLSRIDPSDEQCIWDHQNSSTGLEIAWIQNGNFTWNNFSFISYCINDLSAYPYFLQAFIYQQKRWRERKLMKKLIIKKRIFSTLKIFPTVIEDVILHYYETK